eukprot:s472_g25.t3
MSYFPVLPGAVDDAATPAPSPKMHGLHGHDAGDIEAPRAPVRNVVLTVEQKEKLQQWQRMAEHGFQIHRRAERYYEHVNFWTLSLPSVVLSAVATVWTLATENSQFENSRVYIASISGLGTIVTSIGTYWRWQARMEKNRFASERYNSLTNRLTLLKARLQMGDIEFAHVLQEVESTIHEILKTCGPPDLWVQQRFEWEEKTSQYELLDRLTNLRDVSPWVRCCFPCCWQTVTKLRGNGEVEPSSILDQKIREFSKKTQDVSVDEFKDYFWQLFRMASNTNNLEMCKNLLRAVPNALKDEKDVHFQSLEPSGKSPLHFSVADHFHQLGQWLFETYPREMKSHCLMQDHHGRIPLDYMEPRKALQPHQEGSAFYPVLLFETFQEWCTEMGPYTDDRHSFEDKERMKRIGADLLKRILEWGMRHVDVACTKRHTVLHLLAVHGVEEQEVLGLQRGSPAGSDTAHETGTLLEILLRQKEFDADIRDATIESKAPMELATEQRHAKATKLFFEAMLSEMHEIKDDHQKQDRFKGLKTILEDSLIQLHARCDGHPVERSKDVKQVCCSCAQPERLLGRLKVQDDLRNFVEMKLQVLGYEATLLHYACGADPLIDAARLQHDSGASLARRLLEQRAANSQDSLRKTPLNWAVTKHLPSIAWDICEFGIENDVADVLDDIEHHLASLPEEYALFRVSMDSAKAVPAGFGSLVLWIEFETGARTYLDGCVSPSPEPGKTVLEFRPSNMVAPFQFQLDSDGVQLDKVPGRLSFTLEGLLLGQKDHETGFVIEEQWITLFPNLPLKEWCQTTKTKQRLEFMNYHSKRDGFTIWHLACKHRNLRLSKILRAHNANYGFCLDCKKTPLDCAASTDCEVIMEDADSELEDGLLTGAKAAGVVDSKKQELAKLLLFHDYVCKASRHQMSPKKIARKYFLYFGIEPAVLVAMRDVDGKVLLHYAAYFGLFKDVEWLLEKGAQVDVYDQMSIQDFRFTIMDPPKQELWTQLQKAYALTEIPFPEFCCQKAEREPFNAVLASPTEDVYWLRQEDIPEFATLRVCFQRPERFDGFRWPAKGEDGIRHDEGEPGAVDVKLSKWMMEARACERLHYRVEWLTVNFGHQDVLVDVDDFQSGKYISMHVHRTPLDHALLGAMDNAETMYNVRDTADENTSGISEVRLPPHARICKILIEQALLCEKQEGRTLLAETFASFCRPCHVARGLSKYIVDILVQEPGASAEKTTLLHVAAKHGLRDVCNQLLKYRCTFKEVSMQTPLDVASDEGTYHLLILPAFVSICQKIHTRALPNEDEEAIAARVEQVDQEATAWLSNMESRALSLQKIVRISNPQQGKYTMVDYAAMYGMKRVLAHVIDGLSDIEDETKITCPAEIIGIEMPRYGERNQVIYDLRSLFTAADDRWTSLNLKQKLKDMKEAFKGKTKEELVEALKRELHEHIHYVASLDTEEAIEFFDAALEAKAEWRKKKDATTGDTALHMAARSDNIDIVKLLCEKYKVNKEDKNMNQERPIHSAARNHSYKTMKYLLEGGVQPLPPNFKKEHPMHLLAKTLSLRSPGQRAPDPEEFQEVMSLLMAKVAESNSWMNLTKRDADGKSALEYLVSSCGHTYAGPVVEKLVHVLPAAVLESSCFFAALDNPTGPSRFLKALLKNTADRKILTKLLDQDEDQNGLNVVQICALKGDVDSLREILNALAAPDLLRQALIPEEIDETKLNRSMCDQTPPLILALRHGKEDVAKRLASRMLGLDENHRARVKWEDECRNSQLKQDLISIFNQAGQTFFQLIRSGEVGAVRNLLVAQPALVESADAAGNTALHVAVQKSFKHQKEIVQLLLSHGAVLSEGGQKQETPLHLLCRRSAAQMYQSGMDWPLQRKWEECKAWSPSKDDMLQDSEDGAKDELFTLTKITELILREVVSRCGEDNARAVTDVLSIQAKEGSKTPFDLVSNCLDAAAFLSDHPLRKYLKQAWLKPLLPLTETISLPGTRKLSLLGLAVLLRANEATIRLQHDDPLEGPADETPLTYALMLQQFDLVRKMLARIEEQRLHDRLEDVMMQPHTEGLLFTPQANSEQIPSQIFEVLPSQNVVRLLTRSPGILTRCLQTGNDTLLENMRSKICAEAKRNPHWPEWRFGSEEWGVLHILAAMGMPDMIRELLLELPPDSQQAYVNAKDKNRNTPLHHVLYFVGCIVVSGSSRDGTLDHFIRLASDNEELQWRFEDNSDNWFWPFITKGKQSPDEVPTDKCWKECESSGDLPALIYKDVEDRMHVNVVRELLQFKADILQQNTRKRTPLHVCLHRRVSRASRDKLPKLALNLLGIYDGLMPSMPRLQTLLAELREADGLNVLELSVANIWGDDVWKHWLPTFLAMPGLLVSHEAFSGPLSSVQDDVRLPRVRRPQSVPRLVARLADDESLPRDVEISMAEMGLGSCLAHQRKTLLRSLQKPRESGSIFLVPEPSLESSPLLSLKMPNDGRLEVDFIEVSASEDNIRGNSINVLVGLYALGEPTLKLNGVLGCYLKPPYRKQLITPHYWDFGSWDQSSWIRSVGFPSGSRESGKYYYEVFLKEDPDETLFVGVALGSYAPRHDDDTIDRNEGVWLVNGSKVWFANAEEKKDQWQTQWRARQVLCISVDIDAKSMRIAIDGSGEAQAYRFDPKGKAIYPIVVAQTAFRFAIRKRDLNFDELFPDYEPWLPADQILNPDQKRVVRFSNVPADAESSADLELKLSTSVDSGTFFASTMLATAFRLGCSWDIVEILQQQGCRPTLSSLLAAFRYANAGTKGLLLHSDLAQLPQYPKLLRQTGAGREDLQPWVFGSFLRYLQNNELTSEDIAIVCQRFADCGAPIKAMYGDYIHARDVNVRAKGMVHRLDGCYVRQDNSVGSGERQIFRNLCHTDQWMMYDPFENLWKVGLTQKTVEGGWPAEWHAETPNLEDGKLKVVVDGKDVEDQKDLDATPERDLSNNSKTQRLAKTSRKSDESAALRYFQGKYLVDCFTDLADLLNISEPHRDMFRGELQKQGGSSQDRDGSRRGDEPAAAAAAGSHRHARLSRAVSRAGADVKRRCLGDMDADPSVLQGSDP